MRQITVWGLTLLCIYAYAHMITTEKVFVIIFLFFGGGGKANLGVASVRLRFYMPGLE